MTEVRIFAGMTIDLGRARLARLMTLGLAVALITVGAAAQAQETIRGESVLTRSRPELDPLGARVASFLVFPQVALEERYNDNIFSVDDERDSDFITVFEPELRVESDWNNHALNFLGHGRIGRYADSDAENFDDFTLAGNGRLDILRDTFVFGSLSYSRLHEDRGSPDDVGGAEPTLYKFIAGSARLVQRFNRLTLSADAPVQVFDYDDAPTSIGVINNDDRDRVQADLNLRAGYEIVPQYEAFARLSGNLRSYRADIDDNGLNRDSRGWEAVVGVALDLGGISSGDIFVGYANQTYDDAALDTLGGLTVGAALTWDVTPLTSITARIDRVIEETTILDASGFFATTARIRATHELLRNLILDARFSATLNDYEGVARSDTLYRVGFGAQYMMHRNFYVTFEYDFIKRDSNDARVAGADFRKNIYMIRLQAQL